MKAIYQETRMNQMSETTKLIFNFSMIGTITYVGVFLIAKIFGLESHSELRFINYLLICPITYNALKKYYTQHNQKIDYFKGFAIAFSICALSSLWYAILFFIYLHIDTTFLSFLLSHFPRNIFYPQLSVAFIILTEGVSIGVIVALAVMQIYKFKRGRWNVR